MSLRLWEKVQALLRWGDGELNLSRLTSLIRMIDSSNRARAPSEEIAGLIERIFLNEESEFAVLRVKVRGVSQSLG